MNRFSFWPSGSCLFPERRPSWAPLFREPGKNTPGGIFRITSGDSAGIDVLLYGGEDIPTPVTIGFKTYNMMLRLKHFPLPFTHEEIASRLGLARETVTRQFAALKKSKLIRIKAHNVTICDRKGLEQILQ